MLLAQGRGAPPGNPKDGAPIDLTGYWVAIVSEDWVYRMVVAPKGDAGSVPINDAGKKAAQEWDPAKDAKSCKTYGAAGIIRQPGRNPADHKIRLNHIERPSDGWKWGGSFD